MENPGQALTAKVSLDQPANGLDLHAETAVRAFWISDCSSPIHKSFPEAFLNI